ncbi:hypothetical protein OAJ65_03865, partial [Flavobacteriales bacterium]|nr:hypothetical protein [Flavobacteriales bacterium]
NNSFSSDFVLKTQLRIGPSMNQEASIGIILKAQEDGKGAMIFEINTKGEYRVKQLKGSSYNMLSGSKQNNGWIRNKIVKSVDNHNLVEIRTEDNIFDVYINNNYITTFFIPDYTSGYAGLIITAATKARVSYFYLNEKNTEKEALTLNQEEIATLKDNNNTNAVNNTSELEKVIAENNILIKSLSKDKEELQANILTSNSQNNTLKAEIDKLRTKNMESSSILLMHEKEIKALEKENNNLKTKNSSESEVSKQLHEQISALKTQLSSENKITKSLNKQILELRTQISNEKKNNTIRAKELNKSNTSNSTLIKNLNNEVSALKNENNNLKAIEENFNTLNNELSSVKTKLKTLKATNNELTELFIQKEYEANGVNPSELITKTTHSHPETNERENKNIVYAIQFGVYTTIQSESNLAKLEQLWYATTQYDTYVYYSGQFKSPQEATAHKNTLVSLGYHNAFVVTLNK